MGQSVSNVVLVTVDSLRADATGEGHTPTIDRLADDGTAFERAFATGNWTPFSFPSILASQAVFADSDGIGVHEGTTLAERLSEAGYATAGFNAANGFLTSHWGYDAGFDEFESFVASVGSSVYSRYLATHPTVEAWLQLATSPFRRLASKLKGERDDQAFLDASRGLDVETAATQFLQDTDRPFFLWLHYMDPHTPYVPAPRYIREVSDDRLGTHRMLAAHARTGLGWEVGPRTLSSLETLYRAAVRQTDDSLGRVLDALSAAGIRDETAVVLAGDHGEEFQEHGHLAHYPKLYDELIHVPLIVDAPGVSGPPVERAVGLDAIPPTVCELVGVEPAARWRGSSLVSSLGSGDPTGPSSHDGSGDNGGVTPDRSGDDATEAVVSVTVRGESVTSQPIPRALSDGEPLVSARTADWTLIDGPAIADRELYHRPSDATQQRNLFEVDGPEPTGAVLESLESAIDERLAEIEAGDADGPEKPAADEDLEARLSALGYR